MKRKGFTLIELLAVIVVLGVVALIATPLVLNTIEKAKKGAFQDSVYGLMDAAELYVATNDFTYPVTFTYPEKESLLKLSLKGEKPKEGYIQVLKSGKIDLKVGNGSYCATKKDHEEKVILVKGKCDGESLKSPIITGYGELNQEVSFKGEYLFPNVIATDYRGNLIEVKSEIKTNNTVVDKITTNVFNQVYTIIYTAMDENTNLSSSVTITLKVVDKESPIIEVLGKTEDQTVTEEASTTKTYVMPTAKVTDNSGEAITPTITGLVNLQIPDTYTIKYTATDSSGNSQTLTLTIVVKDTMKPTVSYTLTPSSPDGLNNWYKRDITVNLNGVDDGTGIREYEYALNTNGAYGPYQKVTGTSFTISSESANIRFKLRSRDMIGNTSEEKESPILKLDKTAPIYSTISDLETIYGTSASLTVPVTDSLSGIKENTITENDSVVTNTQNLSVGSHTLSYEAVDQAGNVTKVARKVTILPSTYQYDCTGNVQIFVVPKDGTYQVELWGAGGGVSWEGIAGHGGYTKGQIPLKKGDTYYIYVGGKGDSSDPIRYGYNSGADIQLSGGATDFRLVSGDVKAFDSLKSRLMVAGGGGSGERVKGGDGGGLVGGIALLGYENQNIAATGGTQTTGGIAGGSTKESKYNYGTNGGFGIGGSGRGSGVGIDTGPSGAGGYYGGGGVSFAGGAGGGSSFISGYPGCDAIDKISTTSNIIHTGQAVHYSGKSFTNAAMIAGDSSMPNPRGAGTILGNAGHGYAKITYLFS